MSQAPTIELKSTHNVLATDDEVAEYATWLGLDEKDLDLFWIARQALDTPIPAPWIECQSDDGEVFFYNTRTKESVWDHPYDAFYKAALKKFKTGECTKSELITLVSQPWLLSGTDNRFSHKSCDDIGVLLDNINNPPADKIEPPDSLRFSQVMSPNRARRKASGGQPLSPTSIRASESTEIEIQQLRHQAEDATSRNSKISKELQQMKSDLMKARDYIELLLVENKGLKSRMTEASSKVQQMKHETTSLRDQLTHESKKREIAERKVLALEDRVRALEIASPTGSSRSVPLFSRLCGSMEDSPNTKPVVGRARSGQTSNSVTPRQSHAQLTVQSPDPYKELMALLAVSSLPPSVKTTGTK